MHLLDFYVIEGKSPDKYVAMDKEENLDNEMTKRPAPIKVIYYVFQYPCRTRRNRSSRLNPFHQDTFVCELGSLIVALSVVWFRI